MSVFQSLVGRIKNEAEFESPPEAKPADDAASDSSFVLAPLQLVRTRRDIEGTLDQLARLVESVEEESDIQDLGRRLLDSSRELSSQLQQGFDALQAAQAVTQATITEKSVIVEFIRDRLATRDHYGNPFSLVMFHLDDSQDKCDALNILNRLIRVTDRAYLMSEHEIVIILPETSLEGGRVFARRCVVEVIEQLGTRAFAGVADAIDEDDVTSLIQRADEALYRARHDDFCFAYSHNGEHVLGCTDPFGSST